MTRKKAWSEMCQIFQVLLKASSLTGWNYKAHIKGCKFKHVVHSTTMHKQKTTCEETATLFIAFISQQEWNWWSLHAFHSPQFHPASSSPAPLQNSHKDSRLQRAQLQHFTFLVDMFYMPEFCRCSGCENFSQDFFISSCTLQEWINGSS